MYKRQLPKVPESALCVIPEGIHADGDLDTHYSVYVYARQQGNWIDLFYEGREKFFYLDYTLRACDKLPCPLFCAHSTGDTDVPFSEFTELSNKYHAKRFIVSGTEHDFDRDTENPFTQKVLDETVAFKMCIRDRRKLIQKDLQLWVLTVVQESFREFRSHLQIM